ncbi:MBL fold metallo-hydrolase [Cerasicoccus frondis]|uniref:MBL fold metallo-hydrolase n=1 Tax=Cerasicoccus frondis TaxID=490090 RepID=UPI002852D29B|nr:MBL fold metallo-hydrolase [Cerasicoccus frondis]
MEVIFLGTGTSQGVPMIAHDSEGCDLTNPKNWRTRSSIHVVMDGYHVQVDAAPEFRLQCIRNQIEWIDTFILTHPHADHVQGMDDLRRFCDLLGGVALPVYSTTIGLARIKQIYPYAIGETPASKGYAAFRLDEMPSVLETPGGTVSSTLLPHGGLQSLGLVFEEKSSGKKFAYYNDCREVPPAARELAAGADLVVLDGLRPKEHPTHMSTPQAMQVAVEMGAPQSYLTHFTFHIDHETWAAKMPERVDLAYDGLRVTL